MVKRTGARDIARAKKRAAASLKKAERKLATAERAKSCRTRVEAAMEALEFASHASCEASGYRTFRLGSALQLQADARKLIASCTKKKK